MSSEKTQKTTPKLNEGEVAFASLSEDEGAVLNLKRREFYTLNTTARRLLHGIEQGLTVEQIASQIAAEFDVALDQCRDDLDRFLARLEKAGLIRYD